MKKMALLFIVIFSAGLTYGQSPLGTIDFGTTANGTTATTANTNFAGVRIGSGGGSFTIVNPGQSIGADAELEGIAPTGTSVNSVGIDSVLFPYTSQSDVFMVRFDVYFTGGSSGTWYFFAGRGSMYNSLQSSGFTGAQVFSGLQFVYGASGTMTTNNRSAGSWVLVSGTPFAQDVAYTVIIVGNNSGATVNYGANAVASGTYDLFVNGSLAGDDLTAGQLPSTSPINGFRFYGVSSTSNVAKIYLDNIEWYNTIDAGVLPVEISSFNAWAKGNTVELAWSTATELNNRGFEVQRRDAGEWKQIGFVEGAGTSNAPRSYSFVDARVNGSAAYRLKQIDRDGSFHYSHIVETAVTAAPAEFALEQNYPNPFNPVTTIGYSVGTVGHVTLKVFDLLGKEVATLVDGIQEAGNHHIAFDASRLSSGMYFYSLTSGEKTAVRRLSLIK